MLKKIWNGWTCFKRLQLKILVFFSFSQVLEERCFFSSKMMGTFPDKNMQSPRRTILRTIQTEQKTCNSSVCFVTGCKNSCDHYKNEYKNTAISNRVCWFFVTNHSVGQQFFIILWIIRNISEVMDIIIFFCQQYSEKSSKQMLMMSCAKHYEQELCRHFVQTFCTD